MDGGENWISLAEAAPALESALGMPTAPRDVLPWCGGVELRVQLPLQPAAGAESVATTLLVGNGWSEIYRGGEARIPDGAEMTADGPCSLVGGFNAGLADVRLAATALGRVCTHLRTKNYANPAKRSYMLNDPIYTVLDQDPDEVAALSAAFRRSSLIGDLEDEIARVEALRPTNLTDERYKDEKLARLSADLKELKTAIPTQGDEEAVIDTGPEKEPWIARARELAADIWARELRNNKRPSKRKVAKEVASRLWNEDQMVTRRNVRITADYIVRFALNPTANGGWNPPEPD